MEITKYYLAKVNIGLQINRYLFQKVKRKDLKSKEKIDDVIGELSLISEVIDELNNENIILNKTNSNLHLALLVTERESREDKIKIKELQDKYNELIQMI